MWNNTPRERPRQARVDGRRLTAPLQTDRPGPAGTPGPQHRIVGPSSLVHGFSPSRAALGPAENGRARSTDPMARALLGLIEQGAAEFRVGETVRS